MYRIGFAVLSCLLLACNGKEETKDGADTAAEDNTSLAFTKRFKSRPVPYQLSDTALLANKDTATLSGQYLSSVVPDSTLKKLFGKGKVKFTPMARLTDKNDDNYYIVKGTAGEKKAVLVVVLDKSGSYGATLPFLVPDNDPATAQSSTIDKSFAITRSTMLRSGNDVGSEGKEVLAYDAAEKQFTLVMTDLLNDRPAVLVNPIDTFPKTHRLAGDYYLNKKNLVAVRNGRHPNQILVYIHTENSEGDCRGELKGEFIVTSSTTAVYRQGGDPCVLGLTFTGNKVDIQEESGCGNYRGLDCPLEGTFTRKKEEKPKEATKKTKRPKTTR